MISVAFETSIKWCRRHSMSFFSSPWTFIESFLNEREHRFLAVRLRCLCHGVSAAKLSSVVKVKAKVVERRDRGWWELCRKHRRVLDLSTLDRSGKGHLGSPFPILESSSGSPPHVDTAPAPMLKSTSSSCSYSAVWVAILDSFTLSRCPNSISKICLAVPVMMWKCMCVYE